MFVKNSDAKSRKLTGVEMFNYLTAESGTSISVARGELNGEHPMSVSEKTDRCYMFISGSAEVCVGDETYQVSDLDVVYVPKGTKHSLKGKASYFIVNNPPFKKS